ncbi:Alpha/beta hydrolase family protein [Spironucleus salmonicida]|uniref:Alpha/beta hydrolase family protein n=1 Tax=Spironucleus salmonicida TaxID=348837 RepID=V6LDY5_9EUKA|nr:Alpha/beta hydrolase family protein [Spironucleus salmonicida]|eukprot:EST42710.1 Alpha/beta hydrolase family protein [Spironucleus salmonicida]
MAEENFYIPTTAGHVYACYKDSESQKLVVMIHGLAGTRNSVFFRDIPQFTQHATLRFDFTGQGRSEGEIQFGFAPQLLQLKEVLASQTFQKYTEIIYIGHSKGANLAILTALPGSTVVAVAPRFFVNQFNGTDVQDQIDSVRKGTTLQKEFFGKNISITKYDIDELDSLNFDLILQEKVLKLYVLSGNKDEYTEGLQTDKFKEFSIDGVQKYDCGHFDFKFDELKNKLSKII